MQFPTNVLPPALLDLTLLRVAGSSRASSMRIARTSANVPRLVPKTRREYSSRCMHQAALATSSPPPPPQPLPQFAEYINSPHLLDPDVDLDAFDPDADVFSQPKRKQNKSIAARKAPENLNLSEALEQNLAKLSEVVEVEKTYLAEPTYSEEDLLAFYRDVLAVPEVLTETQLDPEALSLDQAAEDLNIIDEANWRLRFALQSPSEERHDVEERDETQSSNEETSLAAKMLQRFSQQASVVGEGGGIVAEKEGQSSQEQTALATELQPYRRLLTRANKIMLRMEAVRQTALNSQESVQEVDGSAEVTSLPKLGKVIPLAVLSPKECQALVHVAIKESDPDGAELALNLMKRAGVALPEGAVTSVLELYAGLGLAKEAEGVLQNYLTHAPDEIQRHLHIKAHLNATPRDVALPNEALSILHHYETLNTPAPMKTYTLVISRLFMSPSSIAVAQGWDLFTHMRYVAHPDPDCRLFTVMIRACANPLTRRYTSEPEKALDLWTEMTVNHQITPDRAAYNAVILACARSGDKKYVNEAFRLSRQMLNTHRDAAGIPAYRPDKKTFCALLEGAKRIGDLGRVRWILSDMVKENNEEIMVDEEVMMHVFHAYASYKTPFKRGATRLVEESEATEEVKTATENTASGEPATTNIVKEKSTPSLSHIPPQSGQEVISEAENLFQRILNDSKSSSGKLSKVEITTRLLNSYLAIYYKHSTLEKSRDLFWNVFEEHGVERSARTYVEALERCGYSNTRKATDDQQFALKWAEELWEKWSVIERSGRDGSKRLYARHIERAYVAMMRAYTITDNIDRAVVHLRDFAHRYPPNTVRNNAPKPLMRSTRTALVGTRPLVRMTTDAEVPDDYVPPLVTFRDVDILHQRLILYNRKKDIAFLKWLCKAFEWGLRVRRDEAMKAKPQHVDRLPTVI